MLFWYDCPECDYRNEFTLPQVQKALPRPCAECGEILNIAPVSVTLTFGEKATGPEPEKKPVRPNNEKFDDAVRVLVKLGWKSGEARSAIEEVYSPNKSVEEMIEAIVTTVTR